MRWQSVLPSFKKTQTSSCEFRGVADTVFSTPDSVLSKLRDIKRRSAMQGLQRRILASLALMAVIICLGLLAQRHTSLEWLIARESRLRNLVHQHPMQSWLIACLSYNCLSLIPGANQPVERFLWNNHLEVILDSWPCHVTQSTYRPYFGWSYWSNRTPWWKLLRRD